jgi:hypothetical protein
MKVNPQTDELLSAFLDGELSARQQTEVQRMAAHDRDTAERLQQLRNCRTLLNVLPRAEAPADLLEQVKLSLERRSLLEERSILTSTRAGVRHLRTRRLMAAAAMFVLVGVLGLVIYQIVAPAPAGRTPSVAGGSIDTPPLPIPPVKYVSSPFSGRLELSTASLKQTANVISSCVENNGLSVDTQWNPEGTRAVCHISGPRGGLSHLLADLDAAGQSFKTARLSVETDRFGESIAVDAVTLAQVAQIMNQRTDQARVRTAMNLAMLNRVAQEIPGREIQVATTKKLDNAMSELPIVLKPRLASQNNEYPSIWASLEGEAKVKASLTIVLLSAQ